MMSKVWLPPIESVSSVIGAPPKVYSAPLEALTNLIFESSEGGAVGSLLGTE